MIKYLKVCDVGTQALLRLIRAHVMKDLKKFIPPGYYKPFYHPSKFYTADLDLIQSLTMKQTVHPGDVSSRELAAILLLERIYEFMEARDDEPSYIGTNFEEKELIKHSINKNLYLLKEAIENYINYLPQNEREILLKQCNALLAIESEELTNKKINKVELKQPNSGIKGRRQKQIDAILQQAKDLKYSLLSIPKGGKVKIKKECLKDNALFTDSGFDHAWREASKKGLVRVADFEKYCKPA
jgi:hypothetical protein